MTGSSACLVLATSITFVSMSAMWPYTSIVSILSAIVAPALIITGEFRTYESFACPYSPLKVAVIPITLYLLRRIIAERNLPP
jgi:hypothetical protein